MYVASATTSRGQEWRYHNLWRLHHQKSRGYTRRHKPLIREAGICQNSTEPDLKDSGTTFYGQMRQSWTFTKVWRKICWRPQTFEGICGTISWPGLAWPRRAVGKTRQGSLMKTRWQQLNGLWRLTKHFDWHFKEIFFWTVLWGLAVAFMLRHASRSLKVFKWLRRVLVVYTVLYMLLVFLLK